MTETTVLTALGALVTGAGGVWLFMTNLYNSREERITALEEQLKLQNEIITWQTEVITKIVTAVKYSDTLKNSDSLHKLADEIIAELASRKTKEPK